MMAVDGREDGVELGLEGMQVLSELGVAGFK
jgi:hypothetical protein